jgi:hypothetical protein
MNFNIDNLIALDNDICRQIFHLVDDEPTIIES